MTEIAAIAGFALLCGLWVLVQRAAGHQGGGCGACGSGSCSRSEAGDSGACQRKAG